MKHILFLFAITLFSLSRPAYAASDTPPISISSQSPGLRVADVTYNPQDGRVSGSVSVSYGYSAPRSPHIHVYGLTSNGRVISENCDTVNSLSQSHSAPLRTHAHSFTLKLDGGEQITRLLVVAGNDPAGCRGT